VLSLRLATPADRADAIGRSLRDLDGVHRLVRMPSDANQSEVVFHADLEPAAADHVIQILRDARVGQENYVITREDVVAPTPLEAPAGGLHAVAWVELIGQARANSWLVGRYFALMGVAGVIAALGVITDNSILIVGAMAVSPDLLPICATCVGIVGGRPRLVARASLTLVAGLAFAVVVATALAAILNATDVLDTPFELTDSGLGSLASTDYSTVLIALAAGVAGILAFETRASAAVGVAISVTTIPAAGYLGVSVGADGGDGALGALLVLAVNVVLLVISGTLTLGIQERRN
jgi:uncharacterized hydrophobic protein (TIGR00271 family)